MVRRNKSGGVVYKLTFPGSPKWCVGSTVRPLCVRKYEYYKQARDSDKGCRNDMYEMIRSRGLRGFDMVTVVECGECDKATLRQAEQDYWDTHKDQHCLNRNAPLPSKARNKMMENVRLRRCQDKKRIQSMLTEATDRLLEEMQQGLHPHLEHVED